MPDITDSQIEIYQKGLEQLAIKTGTHVKDYDVETNPLSVIQKAIAYFVINPIYKKRIQQIFSDKEIGNEQRTNLEKLFFEKKYVGEIRNSLSKIMKMKEFIDLYEEAFVKE